MLVRWIFVAVALFLVPQPAFAENTRPPEDAHFIEGYPPRLAARMAAYENTLKAVGLMDENGTKGTFIAPFVWPPNIERIVVCFFDSYRVQRLIVTAFALEWTRFNAHIPLDFGDPSDPRECKDGTLAHIRIRLNDKDLHHSAIGITSYKLIPQKDPSMEIGIIDSQKTQMRHAADLRRIVLHEFGHALGLRHEHQNPFSKCNAEYDWSLLEKLLSGPPHNWSKKVIESNMRAIGGPTIYASKFDRNSIMNYSFPPRFYKSGKKSACYTTPNLSISEVDRKVIEGLYPKDRQKRVTQYAARRNAIMKAAQESSASASSKSAGIQILNDMFPEVK